METISFASARPFLLPSIPAKYQTGKLLETDKTYDAFCEFAFPGQCSVLGVYQPELPKGGEFGRFYGFAGWVLP